MSSRVSVEPLKASRATANAASSRSSGESTDRMNSSGETGAAPRDMLEYGAVLPSWSSRQAELRESSWGCSNKTGLGEADRDTMRAEYDFAKGERGVTAARVRSGSERDRCRS